MILNDLECSGSDLKVAMGFEGLCHLELVDRAGYWATALLDFDCSRKIRFGSEFESGNVI